MDTPFSRKILKEWLNMVVGEGAPFICECCDEGFGAMGGQVFALPVLFEKKIPNDIYIGYALNAMIHSDDLGFMVTMISAL